MSKIVLAIGYVEGQGWRSIEDAKRARGMSLDAVIFLREPSSSERDVVSECTSLTGGPVFNIDSIWSLKGGVR